MLFRLQSICRDMTGKVGELAKVNVEIDARAGVPALSSRVSSTPYPALRYASPDSEEELKGLLERKSR